MDPFSTNGTFSTNLTFSTNGNLNKLLSSEADDNNLLRLPFVEKVPFVEKGSIC